MDIEKDKQRDAKIDVSCSGCGRTTKHMVLSSIDTSDYVETGPADAMSWEASYQIVQCQGCESIRFRIVSTNSEGVYQVGPDDWEWGEHVEVFPNPNEGRGPLDDILLLPMDIQVIYEETLLALNSRQRVLCGAGIRALIEAVCRDQNAAGNDLFTKIDDLVAQKALTKDGADILHKLRVLGNKAVHEVKPHSDEQLSLAMDVVEHLIQGVYLLPIQAKRTFK